MLQRLFAVLRTAFFASLFIALWTYLIPRWVAGPKLIPLAARWSPGAIVLLAIGAAIMARCFWDFAWYGLGTPAPWDAPRRLVVRGLYRYVRNPMYLGLLFALAGEAVLLPGIAGVMLGTLAAFWILTTIFVLVYEEPALRARFGDEYLDYCRNVRRWIPRLTPFDKPQLVP